MIKMFGCKNVWDVQFFCTYGRLICFISVVQFFSWLDIEINTRPKKIIDLKVVTLLFVEEVLYVNITR